MVRMLLFFFSFMIFISGCIHEQDGESLDIGTVHEIGTVPKHQSVLSLKGGISLDYDGKVLWVFGETVLAEADINGNTVIPNSAAWVSDSIMSDKTQFDFLLSAGNSVRQFIPYNSDELTFNGANPGQIYLTPVGGVVVNGTGYIYYKKYEVGQYLSMRDMGTGIATVDSGGNVTRLTPGYYADPVLFWESPGYYWGEGAFIARDGKVYLAACVDEGGLSGATRIARVDAGMIPDLNFYEYWGGYEWSSDDSQAAKIYSSGTTASFYFNDYLNRYIALYNNILSNVILIRTSENLTGTWSIEIPLFEGVPPDVFSITDVRAHGAYQGRRGRNILISYSSKGSGNNSDVYLNRYTFSGE